MSIAKLTILGSGSAKPTASANPSGQILELCDKQFLIDCGEGTQCTMAQIYQRTNRLYNIFISHLHGDHCFGLIGLLSTLAMQGRTQDMHIYAMPDLERLMQPWLNYFCQDMPYRLIFHPINPRKHELIYEDRTLTVKTLPLKHRVPCCGFLFEEKPRERHMIGEMIRAYDIPLAAIPLIKQGADFTTADGRIIPNERLTLPPTKPFRYAYCSDTAYKESLIEQIRGVDVLYHEATYLEPEATLAKERHHSTALDAARIARAAEVGTLILGHFSSRYPDRQAFAEEAKLEFENTLIAEDRKVFEW